MNFPIALRPLYLKDLDDYIHWMHPSRKFNEYDAPYFAQKTEKELLDYKETLKNALLQSASGSLQTKKMIVDSHNDALIGQVTRYWKSRETLWMEFGIIIFNEEYWGLGIGKQALTLWVDELFATYPDLVRLGCSTWSGNLRMIRLAESVGFVKEAVYRKARIVRGEYYDSLSYGILREEWQSLRQITS